MIKKPALGWWAFGPGEVPVKEKDKLGMSAIPNLTTFVDSSPTPFHVVRNMVDFLVGSCGFRVLPEGSLWDRREIKPGGRYLVTRNGSSIAAFVMGRKPVSKTGFRIIGAHTDSPGLRLKPLPAYDKAGYVQLAVEPYGGPILASWMNRDLGIAGRIVVQEKRGGFFWRLVNLPLTVSIPNVAIHLNPKVNDDGLVLNKQTHLPPVAGLTEVNSNNAGLRFISFLEEAGRVSSRENIVGCDLVLYDRQKSALGGMGNSFIYSSRLDNLLSCHAVMMALMGVGKPDVTCVAVCYDNEEVGSQTAQGAQSSFLRDVLERIVPQGEDFKVAMARSFAISSDVAHALHPNYMEKYDDHRFPILGGGPVLKTNANQRYATNGLGAGLVASLCTGEKISLQNFVSRSDLACGTTIGPIFAAELGVPTADIGSPLLSMHSIREVADAFDHLGLIKLMQGFFRTSSVKIVEE